MGLGRWVDNYIIIITLGSVGWWGFKADGFLLRLTMSVSALSLMGLVDGDNVTITRL